MAIAQALLVGALGLPQDAKKAAQLTRDACGQGNAAGCTQLAMLEAQGAGPIRRDVAAARKRAQQTCSGGHPPACTLLGTMYSQGVKGKADLAQAARYFEQGCQGGDGNGCAMYGAQLSDGAGVKRDLERGLKLLATSCEHLGSPQGCSVYARALVMGADGKQRVAKGVHLAQAMCARGDPQSCVLAGVGYLEGRGVKRDPERGASFIVVACRAGFKPACKLKQRLPAGVVKKVEKLAAQAMPSPSAAPLPPSGLAPRGSVPVPGLAQ